MLSPSNDPTHRGARPKEPTVAGLPYVCVACYFSDFRTAHNLSRHHFRTHGLGCDTLVEGRGYPKGVPRVSFPLTGYVMRKAYTSELRQLPRQSPRRLGCVTHPTSIQNLSLTALLSVTVGLIFEACLFEMMIRVLVRSVEVGGVDVYTNTASITGS